MTTEPNSGGAYPAAPPQRKWGKWVALGCAAALLLAVAIGAGIWMVVQKATAGPEEAVREFLNATAAGDYARAHDFFSAPLKQVQPLDQFQQMVQANSSFFAVTDASFSNRSVDMDGAELSGNVTVEGGTELPASFSLVRENGDWKLLSYNIGAGS